MCYDSKDKPGTFGFLASLVQNVRNSLVRIRLRTTDRLGAQSRARSAAAADEGQL